MQNPQWTQVRSTSFDPLDRGIGQLLGVNVVCMSTPSDQREEDEAEKPRRHEIDGG